ncbi:YbaN family protein [Pseudoalteromonas sp.]|uniref:YbaN family protein n=1 Tax=Pseudoalteromonas sp. TaxID=53249 RepID=UPI003002FB00
MNLKVTLVTYKNVGYQLLGLALVGLGIIGIVLPVMPTTIFFILALACFTRSSPKLTAWLLNHPRYGATLRHWQEHKVVPVKAKWFAGTGMLFGFILLSLSSPPWWILVMVASIEIAVMVYLLSRPSKHIEV